MTLAQYPVTMVVEMGKQLALAIPRLRGRPRKPAAARLTWKHKVRRRIARRMPVHVTMRLHGEVKNARKFGVYRAIVRATETAMRTRRVRIVHFSIQRTHLHAIVEVDSMMDLARGMQGFQIAAARRINRVLDREGRVFADRYHAHYLESPTETRNAIRYVLNNWRHHREHRAPRLAHFRVDPFSSAPMFGWFSDFNTSGFVSLSRFPRTYEHLACFYPRTWLLTRGWLERGGGPFSVLDTPT